MFLTFTLANASAQYLGNVEFYHLYVNTESKQYSIVSQSMDTKFTNAVYNEVSKSLIFSVSTPSDVIDTVSITMNNQTFSELFSNPTPSFPKDILILINGETKQYRVITNGNIVSWMFYIPPDSTEIELVQSTTLFQTVKTNPIEDLPFATIREYSPLKQEYLGIPSNEIQCNKGLELIFKYLDSSPACVKPETKTKLIERGWATADQLENKIITPEDNEEYWPPFTSKKHPYGLPLFQFRGGASINDVRCDSDLVLVVKHDGSPACVKHDTKLKLIERGWTRSFENKN